MLEKKLQNFAKKIKSELLFNYNLKKLNWFNIGGKAKFFFKPDNLNDLILFLREFGLEEKLFVLGAGSNVLIDDKLFDGAVIKLGKNFSNISLISKDIIVAGSAVTDKKLSNFALEQGVGGFEFLSCIPGTIGGGLKINSGCYGREFKDILLSIQVIDREGKIKTIPSSDIDLKYRKSGLDKNLIFLSASFKGEIRDKNLIKKEIELLKKKKDSTQPSKIKTGGSTFKNPINKTNEKVWKLIEKSVPLSTVFGDAAISNKHCNFLVNKGNASFKDMKNLVKYIKDKVRANTGIDLETEIEIID